MNVKKIQMATRVGILSLAVVFATGAGLALADYDLSGENDTTGPYSENENEWEIDKDVDIEVDNDVDADNDVDVDVNTGENDIEKNTVVEDVSTGDISGELDLVNDVKLTYVDFSNDHNSGESSFDFSNHLTGPYSENENEVEIDTELDVDVDNDVDFDNDVDIYANTGKNDVEKNTKVGDVSTGDIEITGSIENRVNLPSDIQVCGVCDDTSSISADFSNHLTGPDSENKNELELESEIDIDIDNDVDFDNDVDIDANTGKNDVEKNTVVGDVSTGNIDFDFSILNQAS